MANVAYDADDLAPVILHAFSDALAERRGWTVPHLPRYVLRYDGIFPFFVDVGPAVVTTGDERGSHSPEKAGSDELEAAQRRQLAFGIRAVYGIEQVVAVVAVAGHGVGERHR